MRKIKIWFEKLSPTYQIILLILFVYIIYKIYLEIKNSVFDFRKNKNIENERKELISAGQYLTYPKSQYINMADLIYSAYHDTFFTTNFDVIKKIFSSLKNQLDYLELTTAYGTRRLNFSISYVGMETMLNETLSTDDIKELQVILQSKNIKSFL